MDIVIGADHGGYELKCVLAAYLKGLNHNVIDVGTDSKEACDYPDFAFKVAAYVAANPRAVGIMIDGAGIGSSMCANRVPGVLAAVCNELFVTRNAREHNSANVMCIGSQVVGQGLAKKLVDTFIETKFEGGRHQKRVDKILGYQPCQSAPGDASGDGLVRAVVQKVLAALNLSPSRQAASNDGAPALVSEDYVRKCAPGSTITVTGRTIVTDLAKEKAKAMGITVRFE